MMPGDAPPSAAEDPAADATRPPAEDVPVEGDERAFSRPPRWLGRVLWAVSIAAILGPFLLLPVTLEAGDDVGDERPLAAILRAFDRSLAATGWDGSVRVLVWVAAGLALVAAFSLLWMAFANEE